jgi:hypothetical protein
MKTIIAGSRTCNSIQQINEAVSKASWIPTTVISGTARGADQLGEQWAREHKIPIIKFPANWDRDGKAAGYKRNEVMANNAEALIAIWDKTSKGTEHMINIAKRKGLKILIHYI